MKFLIASLIFLSIFSNCKKAAEKPPVISLTPPPAPKDTIVDIGGIGVDSNGHTIGGIWRNGVFTASPDSSEVISLSYSDTNLYALGSSGAYWKFGTHTVIPVSHASKQILANGADLYITLDKLPGNRPSPDSAFGIFGYNAGYWKNGQVIDLTQQLNLNAFSAGIESISVSGTDLYLGGFVEDTAGNPMHAVFWKNDSIHYLPMVFTQNTEPESRLISVAGSDVYNALGFHPQNGYWVNDNFHYLGGADIESVSGMAISDTDVYVIGSAVRQNAPPFIYKNGQKSNLEGGIAANGISISGSDVYVVGYDLTSGNAVYWKNGQVHSLGPLYADCIVIEQ